MKAKPMLIGQTTINKNRFGFALILATDGATDAVQVMQAVLVRVDF